MPVRVLVVDDSAFMRKTLRLLLESDPHIQVVGTASDGVEALEKVKQLRPDVMTLDVEMPRMDGLETLQHVMQTNPLPVVMVSSLTLEGARETLRALELGAVDFIPKQFSHLFSSRNQFRQLLVEKVKTAAKAHLLVTQKIVQRQPSLLAASDGFFRFPGARVIIFAVSTGGPLALQRVVPHLEKEFPVPVIIVQHMPAHFTRSLAERLNELSALTVVEAAQGMPLVKGMVYVAPGDWHLYFSCENGHTLIQLSEEPRNSLFRPSADVTFRSAVQAFGKRVLGVIMTGMGQDGFVGARQIKEQGGRIIAQDRESSVVYGMPRVVAEAGLADLVLPLEKIAPALNYAVGIA